MKRYLIKEVTCKKCEGLGIIGVKHHAYYGWNIDDGELECDNCFGKGYIIDGKDKVTGFSIYSVDELEEYEGGH